MGYSLEEGSLGKSSDQRSVGDHRPTSLHLEIYAYIWRFLELRSCHPDVAQMSLEAAWRLVFVGLINGPPSVRLSVRLSIHPSVASCWASAHIAPTKTHLRCLGKPHRFGMIRLTACSPRDFFGQSNSDHCGMSVLSCSVFGRLAIPRETLGDVRESHATDAVWENKP